MEPLETVAEYLVSSDDREARGQPTSVSIAKISGSRELDLDILITHPKFSDLSMVKVLEYNIEAIADLISAHTTTLVFANTRKMTETIVQKLRPFLGELVAGHHGSGQEHPLGCGKETQVRPFACRCNLVFTETVLTSARWTVLQVEVR